MRRRRLKMEGKIGPYGSSRGVDEEADVGFWVDGVVEEQLADDGVSEEVIDLVAEEDDALPEEEAHDVTGASSTPRTIRLGSPHRRRHGRQ
jgi:hypothetical protein